VKDRERGEGPPLASPNFSSFLLFSFSLPLFVVLTANPFDILNLLGADGVPHHFHSSSFLFFLSLLFVPLLTYLSFSVQNEKSDQVEMDIDPPVQAVDANQKVHPLSFGPFPSLVSTIHLCLLSPIIVFPRSYD